MCSLVVTEYVTLDGIMEDPGGGEKATHGAWSFQFWNEEAMQYKFDELFKSDALLLGRVTYEGFAKAWPTMQDDKGFADRMNSLPKYVVSKTLESGSWNNTRVIKEDIVGTIQKLKEQPGQNILVAGSAILVKTLMENNLVDEYRLMVHPVILGGGKRLFDDAPHQVLELTETTSFKTGIVLLTYKPIKR